jgi:hypothetical protein
MNKWIVMGILISGSAHADIVCKVNTSVGPAQVDISHNSVTITGAALQSPVVYSPFDSRYDGHGTLLITAPGLSITYQNAFGCIRNAQITANFRDGEPGLIESVEAALCSGGSTPDRYCHAPN